MPDSVAFGQGGKRPGDGRPLKYSPKAAKAILDAPEDTVLEDIPEDVYETTKPRVEFAISRALVEAIKAKNAELHYQIKLGQYVDRDAVKAACAIVMATFAQGMRSMQDQMERDLALQPDVVEAIGEYVDTHLDQLAAGFDLYLNLK